MKFKMITLFLLSISSVFAASLSIEGAYVRATPPGVPNSAAFMTLINNISEDISVMKASSSFAQTVELHAHDMSDGVMRMYQIRVIDVAANDTTVLKPGGYHIMFFGLKKPLKEGDTVDLELTLYNGETVKIMAPVKKVMSGMKHSKN